MSCMCSSTWCVTMFPPSMPEAAFVTAASRWNSSMICARMYQAIDAEGKREKKRIGLLRCRKMNFSRVFGRGRGVDMPAKGKEMSPGIGDDDWHEVEGGDEAES